MCLRAELGTLLMMGCWELGWTHYQLCAGCVSYIKHWKLSQIPYDPVYKE